MKPVNEVVQLMRIDLASAPLHGLEFGQLSGELAVVGETGKLAQLPTCDLERSRKNIPTLAERGQRSTTRPDRKRGTRLPGSLTPTSFTKPKSTTFTTCDAPAASEPC